MYVDHMHQPWRTLAAIINKYLSGKTISNDRLRKSRIDILWGMFYKENVDYPELIWEDIAFQIDHRKDKRSRHETMPFPRFTKVIINHFLSQHKSLSKLQFQHYHTIKDDGIMFIKYSTGQIPPKKSRGKGSQGKKTTDTPVADVDVSEEFASRRVIKTHRKIVTESIPEPARRRPSGIAIRDTSQVSKKVSYDSSQKLEGVQSLTLEEQKAADTMQALKESKKTSRRQPGTGNSNEGTGRIPGVPDDFIVVSITSSKGTGTNPRVPDEEKVTSEEKVILEWGSEQESEYSEEEQRDDEETKDELVQGDEQVNDDEDEEMTNAEVEEFGNGDAELSDVAKADDETIEEIKDDAKKAELPPKSSSLSISLGFGDQFLKISFDTSLIGTIKGTTDAEINSLLDIKIQSEVPHIQSPSILYIHFSVISEPSILTPLQETPSVAPVTSLPPSSVSTIPHVPHQTTTPIPTPPIITDASTITIVVPKSDALSDVQLRVATLEKDVSELKKIDHSAEALATLKSQVPTVIDNYLGSKFGDVLQKELQKHTTYLIQKYSVKPTLELTKI
ncbi:hypothetical protein Tco_1345641 [Tanacetum coccineum]